MSRKMIIALDSGTAPQRDAVTTFVRGKGWDEWHWIGDVWLLNEMPEQVTPRGLWEDLIASDPALTAVKGLVILVGSDMTYWGGNAAGSWPWLQEKWGKPDFPVPPPPAAVPPS